MSIYVVVVVVFVINRNTFLKFLFNLNPFLIERKEKLKDTIKLVQIVLVLYGNKYEALISTYLLVTHFMGNCKSQIQTIVLCNYTFSFFTAHSTQVCYT